MILTPNIAARLVAIVVLGVVLQLSFFSRVTLFGVSPEVLPALVVCLGLFGGSLTGAVSGFSVGFLLDCLLVRPLGGSSLVLLGIGYLAGLFRERFELQSALLPPLLCAAGTLVAELGFGAVQLVLEIDSAVSLLVIRDILVKTAFAFFLGWLVYAIVRRALRPALVEEPVVRPRRRRSLLGRLRRRRRLHRGARPRRPRARTLQA
ncbi:MAG TPA: rod shape-determining protein MreD [Solirubrobacterales bacterium]|nr:rod shape-determining protein MreD [Solirubrobacterales bacterium]